MIALLLACTAEPIEELPPIPICNCRPPPDGSVTEEIPVLTLPVDVLLAVDPGLVDVVVASLPSLTDLLLAEGEDARVGLVSTALGDPATAGVLVPLGPEGWWVPGAEVELADDPFPDEPPLGGLGASSLALEGRRPRAAVRLLVAQEADDATPASLITPPSFAEEWARLEDAELTVLAPEPAPRLDVLLAEVGGARFPLGTDVGDAFDAIAASLPGLSRSFPLAGRPDPTTLVVEVADANGALLPPFDQDVDWLFDEARNSVTFLEYVPPHGSTILVRYDPLDPVTSGQ